MFASEIKDNGVYSLVKCTVTPSFNFAYSERITKILSIKINNIGNFYKVLYVNCLAFIIFIHVNCSDRILKYEHY